MCVFCAIFLEKHQFTKKKQYIFFKQWAMLDTSGITPRILPKADKRNHRFAEKPTILLDSVIPYRYNTLYCAGFSALVVDGAENDLGGVIVVTYLSAEKAPALESAWLPETYGHEERTPCPGFSPRQRKSETLCLKHCAHFISKEALKVTPAASAARLSALTWRLVSPGGLSPVARHTLI